MPTTDVLRMNRNVSTLEGKEPDYRFTLANERTFLAYVRTALGLEAAGLAIDLPAVLASGMVVLCAVAPALVITGR